MHFASSPVFFEGKWVQGKDVSAASLYRLWALNDGAFETLHFDGHHILWAERHKARLHGALKALHLNFPEDLHPIFQPNWGKQHLPNTPHTIRITCWRAGEGTYPSFSGDCLWMLHLRDAVNPKFDHLMYCNQLHPVFLPAPPFPMEGKYPSQMYSKAAFGCPTGEEALLVRDSQYIMETPSANVFIETQDGLWLTPTLASGCISGITRARLLQLFQKMGFAIKETMLSLSTLQNARICWLTNTSYGIRPLKHWQGRLLDPGPQETFRKLLYEDGIDAKTM